jgi:5-methylcytosine-specific restriction endonuclease McrA
MYFPSGHKACIVCGKDAGYESRCRKHKKKRTWYDAKWVELSRERRRQFPICEICGVRPSTEVDHIVPRSLAGGVRAVCKPCHRLHGDSYGSANQFVHDERGIETP